MNKTFLKWLISLLLVRKLTGFLARVMPSPQIAPRLIHRVHLGGLRSVFRNWWKRRTPCTRRVLQNMLVGMTISLVLIYLHHAGNPWLLDFEDAGMDWMMRLHVGTTVSEKNVPIAWIDIDENTYRRWGEPLYTPRSKLQQLIAYAADSRARVIVVDIDVSRASGNEHADRALVEFLKEYAAGHGPPLVFARTFRVPVDRAGSCNEVRTGFVEHDASIRDADNIFWASTLFNQARDRVIRRWRLWEPACTEQGQAVVVPSIQLVVATLVGADSGQVARAVRQLQHQLRVFEPESCVVRISSPGHGACQSAAEDTETIELNGLSLDPTPSYLQQRLVYSIPAQRATSGLLARDGGTVPMFVRHAAYPITDSEQRVDNSWLGGSVVIIGNSYPEARDTHATPIGDQAGSLVLANAIYSLVQHGQIKPPAAWLKLIIEVLLILLMSLAFARFNSFWGMLVSAASIIVVLLPVSFALFKSGVWLDFAVPLIGVLLHQMAAEFEEGRRRHAPPVNDIDNERDLP